MCGFGSHAEAGHGGVAAPRTVREPGAVRGPETDDTTPMWSDHSAR